MGAVGAGIQRVEAKNQLPASLQRQQQVTSLVSRVGTGKNTYYFVLNVKIFKGIVDPPPIRN